MTMIRFLISTLLLLTIAACTVAPPEPGLGEPVPWDELDGWEADRHAEAWPALLESCTTIGDRPDWRNVCAAARNSATPSDAEAKAFFERHFAPRPVYGEDGRRHGLITGYYEPLLRGSFQPGGRYRYPLYTPPDDLLTLDLDSVYPDLAGRQLRGTLNGRTVVPYPDRAQLETGSGRLPGAELLWIDDPLDVFFLHVQGSGRVLLPDGSMVAVGFADHNGRPYRSIGARLIELGELDAEDVTLFSIRHWLRSNPEKMEALLHHNPRYVFFKLRIDAQGQPVGSLNVPLIPGRSLAVDPDKIPLGAPVWLETSVPGQAGKPLNRLMMAQDTGGAIRGYARADVFWGLGEDAEMKAGLMKQQGSLFVLLPKGE